MVNLKKTVVILGLTLGLVSCTQTKYFVKSESDLLQIDFEHNILNYIPLMEEDLKNSTVLDTTYKLLVLKKYPKLKKYLSSIKSETQDFYLAKTLYYISKSEYQEAVVNLRMINENHYALIKGLLFIDLSYELAKKSGSMDYKKFLQDYQMIIDKYPDNEFLKKIVALRIRYIRYNY